MKKTILTDIIAALFILLFVYAAVSKLGDHEKFRVQLGQSPLLTAYAGFFSVAVPTVEIIISILLATDRFRITGLYAAFNLMIMFTAYIIAITKFSEFIPCSCGGVLQNFTWGQHLIFNIIFVLVGLTGILLYPPKKITLSR